MRSWVLAAGLLAVAAATGAQAADLYDGPPPDRYGSAYDDPRYADIYRYPVPPPRYAAPPPRALRALRRAADPARARLPRGRATTSPSTCRARGAIPTPSRPAPTPTAACRERWSRSGCCAAAGTTSTTATCAATSPPCARAVRAGGCSTSSIDRCSGEIVDARPLEPRRIGPYAAGRSLRLRARRRGAGSGPTEARLHREVRLRRPRQRAGAFVVFDRRDRCRGAR